MAQVRDRNKYHLYIRIHEGTDEMRQKNTRLYNKILQLQNIPVISLDVLPVYIERYSDELQMAQNGIKLSFSLSKIITELAKIATFRSPRDKSICLINCCKTLSLVIRSHHESKMFVSADELLPLLIYCVIRAQIPSLYLDFEYLFQFFLFLYLDMYKLFAIHHSFTERQCIYLRIF